MLTSDFAQIESGHVWRALLLAMAALFVMGPPAHATCTGIGCSCSVTADPLDFGTYNPIDSSNVDATGNLSVRCGALIAGVNISYEVTLSAGASGNQTARTMSNGSSTMAYNLYTNSSRTIVWGDGNGGTGTITNGYFLNLIFPRTDDFPIYGRIPSGQNAEVGTYTDTITATVIF